MITHLTLDMRVGVTLCRRCDDEHTAMADNDPIYITNFERAVQKNAAENIATVEEEDQELEIAIALSLSELGVGGRPAPHRQTVFEPWTDEALAWAIGQSKLEVGSSEVHPPTVSGCDSDTA